MSSKTNGHVEVIIRQVENGFVLSVLDHIKGGNKEYIVIDHDAAKPLLEKVFAEMFNPPVVIPVQATTAQQQAAAQSPGIMTTTGT